MGDKECVLWSLVAIWKRKVAPVIRCAPQKETDLRRNKTGEKVNFCEGEDYG